MSLIRRKSSALAGARCRAFLLTAILAAVWASNAEAANITPGNLVVFRVGDGTAALGTAATVAFIDEYTVAGGLVQSIPISASGGGAFTVAGNSTTEGILSASPAGGSVSFAGYNKAAGGTNPSADTGAVTNRLIGTIGTAGTIATMAVTDASGAARSSAVTAGAAYLGTSNGLRYINTASGNGTYASTVIDTRNSREVMLLGDETLIASNGSTTTTTKIQSYGVLPTAATAATALVNLNQNDAVNSFWLADLDSGVVGVDTIYAMSTVAGSLVKFSLVGGSWISNGAVTASGYQNITGLANGSGVDLYLTSPTNVSKLSDTSGYNATLTGSLTAIASAGSNTAFRGIAFMAPVPEPATLGLAALVAVGCGFRRRRDLSQSGSNFGRSPFAG